MGENNNYSYSNCPNIEKKLKQSYLAGAEPREKQIQIDAEQIRNLQKRNGELTDKVEELEETIDKLREQLSLRYDLEDKIKELEKEYARLKEINTHTLSRLNLDNGELLTQLIKARTLLQKVTDVCGYPDYDIPVELYSDIADFIKDSEVKNDFTTVSN